MSEITIKPTRTFVGAEGEYSRDNAGPEALKADIDAINKMFNPSATNGGIGKGNLNFSFSDESFRDEITVTSDDGETDETLQESLNGLYQDIADRYTKDEVDTALAALEASVVKNVVIDNDARNISITIDETTETYNLDSVYLVTSTTTPTQVAAALSSGKCPVLYCDVEVSSGTNVKVFLPYLFTVGNNYLFAGFGYAAGKSVFYTRVALSTNGLSTNTLKFMDELVPTDAEPTENSSNFLTSGTLYDILDDLDTRLDADETTLAGKQDELTFDSTPTNGSTNPVTSDGIYDALATKQNTLTFDDAPTEDSNNPVKSDGIYDALATKQDTLTFDNTPTSASTNPVTSGGVYTALGTKQDTLTFDDTPTASSNNPVKSGGVYTALSGKQDTLTIDSAPTSASTNPVSSGGVYTALGDKQDTLTFDSTPTSGSTNPVTSNGIYAAIQAAVGGEGSVFVCTTGTTPSDIGDALTAGLYIVFKHTERRDPSDPAEDFYLPITYADVSTDTYRFGSADVEDGKFFSIECDAGTWGSISNISITSSATSASTNLITSGGVYTALSNKQDTLTFDASPTQDSDNPVKSGGVYTALSGKQNTLTFDSTPTENSTNPVTSDGIYKMIQEEAGTKIIQVPVIATSSYTYDGSQKTISFNNLDSDNVSISGTTSATNAGSYSCTATLTKNNSVWADDFSITPKTLSWSIAKATGGLSINKSSATLTDSTQSTTVTCTVTGDGTVSATSSNTAVATVSVSGKVVTITGHKSGSATITISVGATTNYTAPASKTVSVTSTIPTVYGASWDGTSTTAWTRTDAAASFTDPVPQMKSGSSWTTGSSPFDNLMPWSGMTKSSRTGGTMVAIPKFWYKITQSGSGLKVQIADAAKSGFSVSPAHMDRGDGSGERSTVYVGRYHCATSTYKSTTGVKPAASATRSSFRTSIHNIGTKYWQMDFATRFTLWLLYIVEFADWNSQAKIGYGCGDNSATGNMGYTDSMTYHTGTTQTSRTTYGLGTQYRWIEGLWDNVRDWCDGCYYDSSGLNIILNPNNFSDSSNGTLVGKPTSGYPSAFTYKSVSGTFPMFIPTTSSGSESTYSCDNWYYSSSSPCLYVGGYYLQSGYYGLFCVGNGSTSYSYASIGGRLLELP